MDASLSLTLILATLGVLLVLASSCMRKMWGLGPGKTVALDDRLLHSERLNLVGRPDRIVRVGDTLIPEEWKSTKKVQHWHRLQLATYFLLIEEEYGERPPHGFVVLGDGSRVQVRNTDALRAEVPETARRIREHRAKLAEEITVRQPVAKCRVCGQRRNCSQARGEQKK